MQSCCLVGLLATTVTLLWTILRVAIIIFVKSVFPARTDLADVVVDDNDSDKFKVEFFSTT